MWLYNNPTDSRTFVPKHLGWTVNVATTEGQLWFGSLGLLLTWAAVGITRDRRR